MLQKVELIVLQGNSFCNLNCTYCDLSVESRRTKSVMPPDIIGRLFTELCEGGWLADQADVVWHSGEPLTLSVAYYEVAIALIKDIVSRKAPHVNVRFKIQTNGVLINEDWCEFFSRHKHHLDIGVSCDGPAALHDAYRRNWQGRPSHGKVIKGMDLLQANGIKYKIIAVATRDTLKHVADFIYFFYDRRSFLSGFHFNILADAEGADPHLSYTLVDRQKYYDFYTELLRLSGDMPDFTIQNFAQGFTYIAAARHGRQAPLHDASMPLRSVNMDAVGNITTLYAGLSRDTLPDLFGDGEGLSLGNILKKPLSEMVNSQKLRAIAHDIQVSSKACEAICPYYSVCPGGYEITKRMAHGTFDAAETTECVIHVKALYDALLDMVESPASALQSAD